MASKPTEHYPHIVQVRLDENQYAFVKGISDGCLSLGGSMPIATVIRAIVDQRMEEHYMECLREWFEAEERKELT